MDEDRNETKELETPKRSHGVRSFLLFVLILLAVLAAVVLAAYRDGTGFDVLRRYFAYGTAESAGGETVYRYDASATQFAVVGDSLVVLSGTELTVLDGKGKTVYTTAVNMTAPCLRAGGDSAVAVDIGGTELYVVDAEGEKLHLAADAGEPYRSATLNQEGWLAVTAEKKNYKGSVSVYSPQMELTYGFTASVRFVADAWITDDGKTMAAVLLGQEDSVFVSNVVLYNLSAKDPVGGYNITDGMALELGQLGGRLTAVCDACLSFADAGGENAVRYDYGGAYLREYALGDDYAALLLNRYQSGSVGRLVTVGTDGAEIAALEVHQEVFSISASGRYLAVLYENDLVIYDSQFQEYARLSGTGYARSVLMRPDGSALLVAAEQATLFLP